jgi:hypothetical protein
LEDQLRKVGGVSWPSALVGAAVMLAVIGAYVYFTISDLSAVIPGQEMSL